jgi:ribosomal protein S18 acetylase RimI-like enzyme
VIVRALTPDDAEQYLPVRREALVTEPFAFGASPEDDRAGSIEFLRTAFGRPDQATFGAFAPDMVGTVGISRDGTRKGSHKALIWGMYVRADQRGRGVGRRLMVAALDFARQLDGVSHVHLCVSDTAPAAGALYESLGFRAWGVEPAGLCVNGVLTSERHMVLDLRKPA